MLVAPPDDGITEKLQWQTDVIVADDGSEQTIGLQALPARSWSGSYTFGDEAEAIEAILALYSDSGSTFDWPVATETAILKVGVPVGATTASVNTQRSDFRPGGKVLIARGDTHEVAIVDTVASDALTFVGPLAHKFSAGARVIPMTRVYAPETTGFNLTNTGDGSVLQFNFADYGYSDPFVAEAQVQDIATVGGLPLLARRPVGGEFTVGLSSGASSTRYTGATSIRAPWSASKFVLARSYICNRLFDPVDWLWWKTFFNYCSGQHSPFLVPSYRADYVLTAQPAAAATTIELEGHAYTAIYGTTSSLRGVSLFADDGTEHHSLVTAAAAVGGNDVLTLQTPIPATTPGATWGVVSMLLRARLASDIISIVHSSGVQSFDLSLLEFA